jgi:hypothetical protein
MAADRLGIARGYLTMLEQGKRCPSLAVARVLIDGLKLDAALSNALLNVARSGAGRVVTDPRRERANSRGGRAPRAVLTEATKAREASLFPALQATALPRPR